VKASRGATDLAGIVLVDKPGGMTSHDVINAFRQASGERRVGHAGTLDPMATGLLLVLVGRATRLEQYLVGHDKRYEATIRFGSGTDTLDAEGTVTHEAEVDPAIFDEAFAARILAGFCGPQDQIPPAYSAIKRGGVAAHRMARAGVTPVLEARSVVVHDAQLLGCDDQKRTWDVSFSVSKGTYIRSLARDIGEAAGTVAHLSRLRRTNVGISSVEDATSLEQAVAYAEADELETIMTDPVVLLGLPILTADPTSVRDGRAIPALEAGVDDGEAVALVHGNVLLGVYRRREELLVPDTVLAPGVAR